jgi:hypothetical protein
MERSTTKGKQLVFKGADDALRFLESRKRRDLVKPEEQVAEEIDLTMPEDCLYGITGELARSLDIPLGWAYPAVTAVLACTGENGCFDTEDNLRGTVYRIAPLALPRPNL